MHYIIIVSNVSNSENFINMYFISQNIVLVTVCDSI